MHTYNIYGNYNISKQLAAILDLKVKHWSNHHKNIKYEFPGPQNVKNDILHKVVGQTVQKLFLTMAGGGHFEFVALTDLARTFARVMGANFV